MTTDARDALLTIQLRPIELALLLVHARRHTERQYDPLSAGDPLEKQAWHAIADAVLRAFTPTVSR